jgi:esterase/lipase
MRIITIYASVLIALTAQVTLAKEVDCITINSDLEQIEKLIKNGHYRKLPQLKNTLTFDYKTTQSYSDYLSYARKKIDNENPKAKLKCPIETAVTTALGKATNKLTITDLITPFELNVANSKKAILLIHGLTDSPYLFHDLAAFYHKNGITVRTLLLPGHGTAPEALTDIDYKDWQQATAFAITKTLQDFEQVYLGGFSTGGALILDNLLSSSQSLEKLNGVMLWAPASKAKSSVAWAAKIVDWLPFYDYADKGADIDFAKYESFPLNAGAQVHALMNELIGKLNKTESIPDIPLLTVASQVDATINTQSTIELLTTWHNDKSRQSKHHDTIFYFGDSASLTALPSSVNRVLPKCNDDFCENIIDVAHTSMTISPSNLHYGWQGNYRNCEASLGSKHYKTCKKTSNVILGENTEYNLAQQPSLQRLTFNPSFYQMTGVITDFILKTL